MSGNIPYVSRQEIAGVKDLRVRTADGHECPSTNDNSAESHQEVHENTTNDFRPHYAEVDPQPNIQNLVNLLVDAATSFRFS